MGIMMTTRVTSTWSWHSELRVEEALMTQYDKFMNKSRPSRLLTLSPRLASSCTHVMLSRSAGCPPPSRSPS